MGELASAETRELAVTRAVLTAAATAGDAAALARVYTADPVLMNPNAPDVHGREDIEAILSLCIYKVRDRQ
jgi:ketosteroid isomerase-like protein